MLKSAALTLLAVFFAEADLQAHGLIFPPPTSADIHLSPYAFMEHIKASFDGYHQEHATYPALWQDIYRETNLQLDDKTRCTVDGTTLSVFKKNKLIVVYTVARSDQNDYFIHSVNSLGQDNWCRDKNYAWLFYAHETNELREINDRAEILAHSNDLRRTALLLKGWEFKHPRAFEVLFAELERPDNSVFIKGRVLSRLSDNIPYLDRFKSYLPRLETLIANEAKKSSLSDSEKRFRETLIELRDKISAKTTSVAIDVPSSAAPGSGSAPSDPAAMPGSAQHQPYP